MTNEHKRQELELARDGCLMDPSSYLRLIEAMRDALKEAISYNDNDTAAILGNALGYERTTWGDWVIPQKG